MANWKKIIVSGSQAHLAGVTASALPIKAASNVVGVDTNGEFFKSSVAALGAYTWYVSSSNNNAGVSSGSAVIFTTNNGITVSQSNEPGGIKLTHGISSISTGLLSTNSWLGTAGAGTEAPGTVVLGGTASIDLDYTGSDNFIHISNTVTQNYLTDYIALSYQGESGVDTPVVKKITVNDFIGSTAIYTGSAPNTGFTGDIGGTYYVSPSEVSTFTGRNGIVTSASLSNKVISVALDIDSMTTGTVLAAGDYFAYSDNGTEKKITLNNLASHIVSNYTSGESIRINASSGLSSTGLASLDLGGTGSLSLDYTTTNNFVRSAGSGSIASGDWIIFNDLTDNDVYRTDVNSLVGSAIKNFGLLSSSQNIFTVSGSGGIQSIAQGDTLNVIGTVNEVEAVISATDTITLGLPDDVVITNDLTVGGNLVVEGTTTVLETENLLVEDRFILLASGSTSGVDGGIVVQNTTGGTGNAYYYDANANRWSYNTGTSHTATSVVPEQYAVTVSGSSDQDPDTVPYDFGNSATNRIGMMHINRTTEEIWIYA